MLTQIHLMAPVFYGLVLHRRRSSTAAFAASVSRTRQVNASVSLPVAYRDLAPVI